MPFIAQTLKRSDAQTLNLQALRALELHGCTVRSLAEKSFNCGTIRALTVQSRLEGCWRSMKRSVLLLGFLAFLAGCASAPTAQTAPTPTPKPVAAALDKPTYTVQRGTVADQLQLSGRVGAVQQQDLSFTQDGHLKTLYVTRTSVITAGQLLAELDLGELPNQLRQAQVGLEQAQLARERDAQKREFDQRRAQID